jgi:aminopeptidase N
MARWAFRMGDKGPLSLGQRVGHVENDALAYRAVVYDKGALVLHMLRRLIGDEAFFAGLRAFQQRHRFRTATTHDLQLCFETAAGQPLRPFFEHWLSTTVTPELRWSFQVGHNASSAGYVTTVTVRAKGLPGAAPLDVRLELPDAESRSEQVRLGPLGGTFRFVTASRPRRVTLNEDWGLLARVRRDKGLRP